MDDNWENDRTVIKQSLWFTAAYEGRGSGRIMH